MAQINFKICSIDRENEIFSMVKENLEFLKNNKIRFTWPQSTIEKEYDQKTYTSYKTWLTNEWIKRECNFLDKIIIFFNLPEDIIFEVEVSNYGPFGFYHSGLKRVTININNTLDVINTIKHEIIHIILDKYIIKYKIKYTDKEFIIKTILDFINEDN